jgi:hypothetical protein
MSKRALESGLTAIVLSNKERRSISCTAPSGMSRPPKRFSAEDSGAEAGCRAPIALDG